MMKHGKLYLMVSTIVFLIVITRSAVFDILSDSSAKEEKQEPDILIETTSGVREMEMELSGATFSVRSVRVSTHGVSLCFIMKEKDMQDYDAVNDTPQVILTDGTMIPTSFHSYQYDAATGEAVLESTFSQSISLEETSGVRVGQLFLPLIYS